LHLTVTGNATPPTVPSGCGSATAGLGIAGASLLVGCPGNGDSTPPTSSVIRQLDKRNGNSVRSFNGPTGVFVPAGLSDDPTTFGLQFKEVLWTKDESFASSQLLALEIPGGTSGQTVGPPALFPAACTGGTTPDLDGDGLLDCWEDGTLWPDG